MPAFNYSVSLHVSHPHIDPQVISQALSLEPTHRPTRKGDRKSTPTGIPLEGHWKFSHWCHSFGTFHDLNPVSFLSQLAVSLHPHEQFLQQIVAEGGSIQILLGIFVNTNWDQILPFDLSRQMADLRIDLRLDVYGTQLRQVEHPIADEAAETSQTNTQ